MRTLPFLLIGVFTAGACYAQNPQFPPVPPDPLELVTGPAQPPASAADRGALVTLINRAIDHYALHIRGTPAHVLQMTFNATASTAFPGGAGSLRETWISGQNWRWDGGLAGYSLVRISANGAIFDQNADSTIPVRIKMLANAVFAPIEGAPRQEALRSANVSWKNSVITCVLTSPPGALLGDTQPATGRHWNETEYCIDPASGLLEIYSMTPGIYTVYDYANPLQFHGRELPGRITISENGATVMDAQLTSLAETDPANTSAFTPTAQMIAQGPAIMLGSPFRMRLPLPVATGGTVEAVIVHAIIDGEGNVRESEALQSSGFTAQALDFAGKMKFGRVKPASGAGPVEREMFINVEARPAPVRAARLQPPQ